MKSRIFLTLCFSIFVTAFSYPQSSLEEQKMESSQEPRFLPVNIQSTTPPSLFDVSLKFNPKQNNLLFRTGYLLQGLKFSSAVDQFNATAPFDIRGYKPNAFGSYSHIITQNYLLAQPIQPIK